MKTADALNAELIELVQLWAGPRSSITSQTALYQDLSIGGDDLYEVVDAVATRYGTSFDGFDFESFGPNEPEVVWELLATKLGLPHKRFQRLTIEQLSAVVVRGKWIEPDTLRLELPAA